MIYIGIPARMASSRMPNKPMTLIWGRPMIAHVYNRCMIAAKMMKRKTHVFIATPDVEIMQYCKENNMNVYRTPQDIPRPCLRVMDAVKYKMTEKDILIVVQGDEPVVDPNDIVKFYKKAIELTNSCFWYASLILNGYTDATLESSVDPNELSVVLKKNDTAMYFSRNSVPNIKFAVVEPKFYKQVCIFAYNIWACEMMMEEDCGQLENTEFMEMMRPLENDIPVHMIYCNPNTHSVDVIEDVVVVEKILYDEHKAQQAIDRGG